MVYQIHAGNNDTPQPPFPFISFVSPTPSVPIDLFNIILQSDDAASFGRHLDDSNVDVIQQNTHLTILDFAIIQSRFNCAKLILERYPKKIDEKNTYELTPLMLSTIQLPPSGETNESLDFLSFLLARNVDVNAMDSQGISVLQYAWSKKLSDRASLLIIRGAYLESVIKDATQKIQEDFSMMAQVLTVQRHAQQLTSLKKKIDQMWREESSIRLQFDTQSANNGLFKRLIEHIRRSAATITITRLEAEYNHMFQESQRRIAEQYGNP